MKTYKLLSLLAVMALLIAACAPTSAPAVPAAPTREPTGGLSTRPNAEAWANAPDAALSARQLLAQQLRLDMDTIGLVAAEKVDWPDGCLGISIPGITCAQIITPGYKVVLAADGGSYEYHTDLTGGNVMLASAPEPDIKNPAIVWTQDDGGCHTAIIGGDQVAFGFCGGPLMTGLLIPEMDRLRQLADFVKTYVAFEADTPAGHVKFTGAGTQQATPAEQRMIAEWARLAQTEAYGGRSGASYGLILAWHREGGIAGFCDDLSVYVTGVVYASSCKSGHPNDLGQTRLNAEQLKQIFDWVDSLMAFEVNQTDPAVADAMTIRMVFSGAGIREATPADMQAVQDFAAQLFADLSK